MAADEPENLVLKILAEMRTEMREQFSALDTKLSRRIDDLDAKVDRLSLRIDALEARMDRLERNVEGLSDSINTVLKNLRVLLATHDPERLDKIEQRLSALERAMVGGSSGA